MPFCTQCGETVEEGQKVCSHCGESLSGESLDTSKKSPEKFFAVPIDYSEVREAIPVGEDINYSCLFTVNYSGPSGLEHKFQTFQSHVLFTDNGIAYQEPKGGVMKSVYRPWHKIDLITAGVMMFTEGKLRVYNFTMIPTTKYVSSEDFDMWMWRFMFKFSPHIINEKKKYKYTKGLKRFEKTYNKIVNALGEEECEFFRTNVDYEEFKKHQSIAQKAMLEVMPKWAQFLAKKFI